MADVGVIVTKATVWFALLAYFVASGLGYREGCLRPYRAWWTGGCLCYLAHVVAAFQFHHDWSHPAAQGHTAAVTASVVGWNWGGGIWFNHLFTLLWVGDAGWMWVGPDAWLARSRTITYGLQAFFFFMIFNAAVVFADGPVRWFGLLGCAGVGFRWWKQKKA